MLHVLISWIKITFYLKRRITLFSIVSYVIKIEKVFVRINQSLFNSLLLFRFLDHQNHSGDLAVAMGWGQPSSVVC